jgi:hypothetical protein
VHPQDVDGRDRSINYGFMSNAKDDLIRGKWLNNNV